MMNDNYNIDVNVEESIINWVNFGLPPGSFTECLLRGQNWEAYTHAHPMIKSNVEEYVYYVQNEVPIRCKYENYDEWAKPEVRHKYKLDNAEDFI